VAERPSKHCQQVSTAKGDERERQQGCKYRVPVQAQDAAEEHEHIAQVDAGSAGEHQLLAQRPARRDPANDGVPTAHDSPEPVDNQEPALRVAEEQPVLQRVVLVDDAGEEQERERQRER
jgi:hypothetical protein